MAKTSASVKVPGRAADAELLWYEPVRWPSWVDGFGHLVTLDDAWPNVGARRVWDSPPGGRGRVTERVTAYEIRSGQSREVEDDTLRGTERVEFKPGPEETEIVLSLEYELKDRHALTPVVDALFVRRALRDSLARTLSRFSYERKAEMQFG